MTDYVAGISLWSLSVLQLNPWISRWVFGNKGRFLTVIGQKWSWCHFIKDCLVLSHLISTCHFSFIQQGKVEIISYPLVCHSPSFQRVHSTVTGIVVTVSVEPPVLVNSLSWFCLILTNTDIRQNQEITHLLSCPRNGLWYEYSKLREYVSVKVLYWQHMLL